MLERAMVVGGDSNEIGILEAHGTGTALGDPTEVGSLCQAISATPKRWLIDHNFSIKGGPAREPSAGMSGLALLLSKVEGRRQFPNAHLRVMNRHKSCIPRRSCVASYVT